MKILVAVIRRLGYSCLLLFAVMVFNFIIIHLAPGDPVDALIGEMGAATEEFVAEIRHIYGLDKSLPEQLFIYIGNLARGNLGNSFYYNLPVNELLAARVLPTLLLMFLALICAVGGGVFLGILGSEKPKGLLHRFTSIFALVGWSTPVFWLGILILILFGRIIPLFPISGMYSVLKIGGNFWVRTLDTVHHLVLPVGTLAFIYLAQYSRLTLASMIEVLNLDYIRSARAKGLTERAVIFKHALKNAILPVVTVVGLQMGYLFSGSVLVETVFNWPGLGRLAFKSILRRDYPTVLGILFFSTIIVIVANLLTDLSYRLLDPRIRTS